jgi:hypothetical protein
LAQCVVSTASFVRQFGDAVKSSEQLSALLVRATQQLGLGSPSLRAFFAVYSNFDVYFLSSASGVVLVGAYLPATASACRKYLAGSPVSLALRADGLGSPKFGQSSNTAIFLVAAALGRLPDNTQRFSASTCLSGVTSYDQWSKSLPFPGQIGNQNGPGLVIYIDGSNNFAGYRYDGGLLVNGVSADLKTEKGVTVGDQLSALKSAYADAINIGGPRDSTFTVTADEGSLSGALNIAGSSAGTIQAVDAGLDCSQF